MARRNLGNRKDIQPDALRQRRDLYAIAIGLMLFYAAGGGFSQDANVGSMFAVHLKRPGFILWAAWAGLIYFWWRFWLITEARPMRDFFEDVDWQAGDTVMVRRITQKYVSNVHSISGEENAKEIVLPGQHVPKIAWKGLTLNLSLAHLRRRRSDDSPKSYGPHQVELESKDRAALWRAWLLSVPRGAWFERSFTDYTLPHLFALATMGVATWACLHGEPETTKPRTAPQGSAKVTSVVLPAVPASVSRSVPLAPPARPSETVPKTPNVSPKIAPKSAVKH